GVAFAIAFKMGLFNIGVEGQYKVAALFAAFLGAKVHLPSVLHIGIIVVVAMVVGTIWAGIAGVLKVTRGVHEVISTIMLNFIATALVSYLLANHFLDRSDESLNLQTAKIPTTGGMPTVFSLGRNADGDGFLVGVLGRGEVDRTRQTAKSPTAGWRPPVFSLGRNADVDGFLVVFLILGLLYYLL